MSCSEQLLFFKEWASYLRRGEVRCVEVVLRRTPANPSELAFLLEVAAQLCMLRELGISYHNQSPRNGLSTLPNFINFSQHLLTQDYVRSLISIHDKANMRRPNHVLSSILIGVLDESNSLQIEDAIEKSFQCLKIMGKLYYLLSEDSNSKQDAILQDLKDRWTTRKLIGQDWRQSFVNLLILWSANQAKNEWMGDIKAKIEDYTDVLLGEWCDCISFLLENCPIIHKFLEEDLIKANQEGKIMAKNLKLKIHKNKRQIILQMKRKILQNCNSNKIYQERYQIVGYYFAIISGICSESDEKLENVITLQDLISNQAIFYCCLWGLSTMDQLQFFTSFSSFMRSTSQYNILIIYQKINCNLALTDSVPIQSSQTIVSFIETRNKAIFHQFNVQPVTTAKILLEYYLHCSGVPLPKTQKNHYNRRQRQTVIIPTVADPLHFMMVSKKYWEDSFHREVLEIALWMCLDSYCRWTQNQSFRDISEKEVQQYLKKLNIAITVFFFSLDHPTHLLQYQPVQCDILKQLFVQAVFPSLVLNCKYFFQGYNWQTQKILSKLDSGLENWVLPWSHLLINPKTMVHFIYLERGYELAHRIVTQNRSNFDRVFGDFFNTRILTELQGLGINLTNGEAEAKQKISFIHPQRKKYMVMLLKESEKGGEKTSHTARRILQILI